MKNDRDMLRASSNQKIRPLWRWLAAALALAIVTFQIVGYQVARSINLNYFKDPSVPVSALDIVAFLFVLYLIAIAAFGTWRFRQKGS